MKNDVDLAALAEDMSETIEKQAEAISKLMHLLAQHISAEEMGELRKAMEEEKVPET